MRKGHGRSLTWLICKILCGYLTIFLLTLFFSLMGFLIYFGIVFAGVEKGIRIGFEQFNSVVIDQIETVILSQFETMKGVISRFNSALRAQTTSSDPEVRDVYRSATLRHPMLIRDIQVGILSNENIVRGLGFVSHNSTGSFSLTLKLGDSSDPYYVVYSDPEKPQDVILEDYSPFRNSSFRIRLDGLRFLTDEIKPDNIPTFTTDKRFETLKNSFGIKVPFLVRWEEDATQTGNVFTISPLEATQKMLEHFSKIIPVKTTIIDTDTGKVVVTDESFGNSSLLIGEFLRDSQREVNFLEDADATNEVSNNRDLNDRDINRDSSANLLSGGVKTFVEAVTAQYGNLSRASGDFREIDNSYYIMRNIQSPYRWSIVISVKNLVLDIWKKVQLGLLFIAIGLAFFVTIPVCCLLQSFLCTRMISRKLNG